MAREDEVKVGMAVKFRYVLGFRDGIVTEDRGGIGVGGRHLYRIESNPGLDSEVVLELPAERLELLQPHRNATAQPIETTS